MARGPFPSADFGRRTSGEPINAAVGAGGAGAAAALGGAAEAFSRRLRGLADAALTREGQADAMGAIGAEAESGLEAGFRGGFDVDDQAYDGVLRVQRRAQLQAAYVQGVDEIETANPDSPGRFIEGLAAMRAGFRPTGDPETDVNFSAFTTIQDATALNRVRGREEERRVDVARGAFTTAMGVEQTALGQAVASAGFDTAGAQAVGLSLNRYASQLAQFGPRAGFTVGGVEFPPDETRLNAVSAEAMGRLFDEVQAETRLSWIRNAGDRMSGAAGKAAFAGQVRERWEARDPMFAGLSAPQVDQLTAQLEGEASRAATDERAQLNAAGETARDLLRAMEYGGEVDPDQLRGLALASGDVGLQAEAEHRLTYGFESAPGGRGPLAGQGFEGWVPFLMDRLEGPGLVANDNGRGRAQWGITEQSHPQAWRDGRVDRAEAAAIYKREYWDAIGGDALPPDLAFVAASAAVVGGVGTARELLAQANGSPERFLQLEMARFERLAAQDPARFGDDLPGWRARIGRERAELTNRRAQVRQQEGFASDPLEFAQGNRQRPAMATVPAFDPASVFGEGPARAAWTAAMRARRPVGRQLAQQYGVPQRVLTNAETAFYKDEIARDPASVTPLVTSAVEALGGDGARAMLGELGRAGVATADLHLAWLATETATRNVAIKANEGRVLRAGGARVPDLAGGDTIAEALPGYAAALGAQPDLLAAVRAIAEDMAISDGARGRPLNAGAYLNSALGATNRNGETFGGLARVNGGATLAPVWLRADSLEDALEIAARGWAAGDRGPVYTNGEPIPASVLNTYQLRAMPSGRYQLVNRASGGAAVARSGRAFEFNIEAPAFRAYLRERLPGAVLEGD